MAKPVIYIAGPMRGRPEHNFPAFREASERFEAAGWLAVSPVLIGQWSFGNDPTVPGGEYLKEDIKVLVRCNAIAVLPEWEHSTGARCEAVVAVTIGLPFYDAVTGEPIPTPTRIVCAGSYERPAGRVETLDGLADEIRAWQRDTFPAATPSSIAEHLRREAEELCKAPSDPEEMADLFMLICGASRDIDLAGAVRAKLEKNKRRRWGQPDAHGVVEHIAEPVA